MSTPTAVDVRTYVLGQVKEQLDAAGLDASDLGDDTDLLAEGVLDSLGVLELMEAVGDRYGIEGDWDDLDPEEILVLGPFCRYVERQSRDGTHV